MSLRPITERSRRKSSRNQEISVNSGRIGRKVAAGHQQPLSFVLGAVEIDFVSGSALPWALPQGQGTGLLICLKGEAFYTSQQTGFAFGPRATALVVPAHQGTLLVGPGGLVVHVNVPLLADLHVPPDATGFDQLRRLLGHLASVFLDDGDRAFSSPLANAYGTLIIETIRADLSRAQWQEGVSQDHSLARFALAKDYIRAHLFERVRLSDVALALNVSARTVQLIFTQEAGESLTQYVARLRLEEAHQRLLRGDFLTNVTQIAMDCGFNHAGLFSAAYRRAFGELPRDTLARVRSASQGEIISDELPMTG